jgi:hypothetical protein
VGDGTGVDDAGAQAARAMATAARTPTRLPMPRTR